LPPHGAYPAHYASLLLPDMDLTGATETVHDYNPGATGSATGVIYEYTIEFEGSSLLHFDVTGLIYRNPGADTLTFAPFSHDAYAYDLPDDPGEPDLPIAEPNALSVLAGMLAVAGLRRRRRA
jgi:MYXO-CTERM domain-containing protein